MAIIVSNNQWFAEKEATLRHNKKSTYPSINKASKKNK
jgi:hypothetical protein